MRILITSWDPDTISYPLLKPFSTRIACPSAKNAIIETLFAGRQHAQTSPDVDEGARWYGELDWPSTANVFFWNCFEEYLLAFVDYLLKNADFPEFLRLKRIQPIEAFSMG